MQLAIPTFSCSIGLRPATALSILAAAGFCCCVPMAMPQGPLLALCTDVGISASVGAAMLSMLLGLAFLSRQFWGLVADRIGGYARSWLVPFVRWLPWSVSLRSKARPDSSRS
jgi:hypothetical protein